MGCGVDPRHSLDLVWLWHRRVALAPIGPLAWEPPYAPGAALKKKKIRDDEGETWQVGDTFIFLSRLIEDSGSNTKTKTKLSLFLLKPLNQPPLGNFSLATSPPPSSAS